MEIGNNNLIRLSNGPGETLKLLILCKFRYEGRASIGEDLEELEEYIGDEFLCVRKINDAETIAYGNYFFMHVVEGLDGQTGCKRVRDIQLAEALLSELLCTTSLAKVIKNNN